MEAESKWTRVLLIEDDEDDVQLVKYLFSDISVRRFQLEWVSEYEVALASIISGEFDVCLLDYQLGERTGLDVLKEALKRGCKVPIIVLTGHGDYAVDMEAMKAGASDYLPKAGLNRDQLERSIRYTLERSRTREALRRSRDELEVRVLERTEELSWVNEALRLRSQELQLILDTVPATICFKDLSNKILHVNKAATEMVGLTAAEMERKHCAELFPDWLAEKYYQDDLEVINSGIPKFGIEEQYINAAGEMRWVSTDKLPWFDKDGSLTGVLAFAVDITARKLLELELIRARDDLELKVIERTKEIEDKSVRLAELNTALKALLRHREEDQKEFEESIISNVRTHIAPYLEKLKSSQLSVSQKVWVEIIESHLQEVTSPFTRKLAVQYMALTPTEIRVADYVKDGRSTKEMAELLCISHKTVAFHRDNIRRKLGLRGGRNCLRSYLLTLT